MKLSQIKTPTSVYIANLMRSINSVRGRQDVYNLADGGNIMEWAGKQLPPYLDVALDYRTRELYFLNTESGHEIIDRRPVPWVFWRTVIQQYNDSQRTYVAPAFNIGDDTTHD